MVVDVLKSGNQAREYGVEFGFQFLSFRAAAKEREQAAPQVVIVEVGERVFDLDLVGGNQARDFGGCCHGLNGLIPPKTSLFPYSEHHRTRRSFNDVNMDVFRRS